MFIIRTHYSEHIAITNAMHTNIRHNHRLTTIVTTTRASKARTTINTI